MAGIVYGHVFLESGPSGPRWSACRRRNLLAGSASARSAAQQRLCADRCTRCTKSPAIPLQLNLWTVCRRRNRRAQFAQSAFRSDDPLNEHLLGLVREKSYRLRRCALVSLQGREDRGRRTSADACRRSVTARCTGSQNFIEQPEGRGLPHSTRKTGFPCHIDGAGDGAARGAENQEGTKCAESTPALSPADLVHRVPGCVKRGDPLEQRNGMRPPNPVTLVDGRHGAVADEEQGLPCGSHLDGPRQGMQAAREEAGARNSRERPFGQVVANWRYCCVSRMSLDRPKLQFVVILRSGRRIRDSCPPTSSQVQNSRSRTGTMNRKSRLHGSIESSSHFPQLWVCIGVCRVHVGGDLQEVHQRGVKCWRKTFATSSSRRSTSHPLRRRQTPQRACPRAADRLPGTCAPLHKTRRA